MGDQAGACGGISRCWLASRPLCAAAECGGDQFVILPAASRGDLCALGSGDAGDFTFAVKMPRAISHESRLKDAGEPLRRFVGECGALGGKLGCILVQLPPSLVLDTTAAERFFADLRALYSGKAACEPRHASWFTPATEALLQRHRIARVAADPIPKSVPDNAARPGGFDGFAYWRLHGSPRIYYSDYDRAFLKALLLKDGDWCIFDNTALGHATANALAMPAQRHAG